MTDSWDTEFVNFLQNNGLNIDKSLSVKEAGKVAFTQLREVLKEIIDEEEERPFPSGTMIFRGDNKMRWRGGASVFKNDTKEGVPTLILSMEPHELDQTLMMRFESAKALHDLNNALFQALVPTHLPDVKMDRITQEEFFKNGMS